MCGGYCYMHRMCGGYGYMHPNVCRLLLYVPTVWRLLLYAPKCVEVTVKCTECVEVTVIFVIKDDSKKFLLFGAFDLSLIYVIRVSFHSVICEPCQQFGRDISKLSVN